MLDTRYWMLDTGYWPPGTGTWFLVAGCWKKAFIELIKFIEFI